MFVHCRNPGHDWKRKGGLEDFTKILGPKLKTDEIIIRLIEDCINEEEKILILSTFTEDGQR